MQACSIFITPSGKYLHLHVHKKISEISPLSPSLTTNSCQPSIIIFLCVWVWTAEGRSWYCHLASGPAQCSWRKNRHNKHQKILNRMLHIFYYIVSSWDNDWRGDLNLFCLPLIRLMLNDTLLTWQFHSIFFAFQHRHLKIIQYCESASHCEKSCRVKSVR